MSTNDGSHEDPSTASLDDLMQRVAAYPEVQNKRSIQRAYEEPLGETVSFKHPFRPDAAEEVDIGDDCAALPDGHGGYQLFAAEGILPAFVQEHPWFAGYSAVMVNVSDICAMGGLPQAVTDTLWVRDPDDGGEVWAGMRAAAEAFDVPIVGGHTTYQCENRHLGVSILGHAPHLLTSHDARPGEVLLMAVDLDGQYVDEYPFWNAATDAPAERLRTNQKLMATVARKRWARAAKDISMGGIIGTLAMLLHTSQVGATLQLEAVPKPPAVGWEKWLVSFPSYGFLLAAAPQHEASIKTLFRGHDVACEAVGEIQAEEGLHVDLAGQQARVF